MYLDKQPTVIDAGTFTSMPDRFRKAGAVSEWAAVNKPGENVDSFIEGPAFDSSGNLYLVDLAFGRIFRITPDGDWSIAVEYDGEPNGLKACPDGRFVVTDYRRGLLTFDPESGRVESLLVRRNAESFKGLNDLTIASNGDIYFTDQGQTGLHDPAGSVYRLRPSGQLDCLMSNLPSPNGLVLDREERVLYVAMTRDNSVWRAPLSADGGVGKVGRFCSMFGTSGPDGIALDEAGRLLVAHASLGQVFVFASDGQCVARIRSTAGFTCTNVPSAAPTAPTSTSQSLRPEQCSGPP